MAIRKVAALLLKYDYGIASRGMSLERLMFLPALEKTFDEVSCFWLEENGFPDDIDALQDRALAFVEGQVPDLVFFILLKDEIRLETLRKITAHYATANYFCDDQWRYGKFSSRLSIALTWAITTDKYCVPKYQLAGGARPILTQWGSAYRLPSLGAVDYEFDVSFVGSANSTRRWYVDELGRRGIRVECFGQGWPNGRVDFARMNEIFLRSRINLNLSNSIPANKDYAGFVKMNMLRSLSPFKFVKPVRYAREVYSSLLDLRDIFRSEKSIEQVKARTFEIPAAGGFQLCRYALGLEDFFIPGKEIAVYSDIQELAIAIEYYLSEESERMAICRAGYERSEGCDYGNRFAAIRKEMESGHKER